MEKILKKNNLSLPIETDIIKMQQQIQELERLLQIIKNSDEFKSLFGKTQMIGDCSNNQQSRAIHTIGVSDISLKIVRNIYENFFNEESKKTEKYKLNKKIAELYVLIIGYSHDLGHTPFGHVGESALNEFLKTVSHEDVVNMVENRRKIFGQEYEMKQGHFCGYDKTLSFEHNEQSAKNFYKIAKLNKVDEELVDINRIISGILVHSTSRVAEEDIPNDIVIQSVRLGDKIQYSIVDYNELGIQMNIDDDIELSEFIKKPFDRQVDSVIKKLVKETFSKGKMDDHMEAMSVIRKLKSIGENCIYLIADDGKRGLLKSENTERIIEMTKKIAEYYYKHPEKIPVFVRDYRTAMNGKKSLDKEVVYSDLIEILPECTAEKVLNYVGSMDNVLCQKTYEDLVKSRILTGDGIEPIMLETINKRKEKQLDKQVQKMKLSTGKTTDECRRLIQIRNMEFISNRLPDEAKYIMQNNRIKYEKEFETDQRAYELMLEADERRKKVNNKNSEYYEYEKMICEIENKEAREIYDDI